MTITEIIVPAQDVAWLPWAVQYFFFIGLSTAAALLASAGEAGGPLRRLQPAAVLVAVSAGVVAPVALLADLHQPGRFWHFYAHFTPWSWMSIGSLLLPAYVAALLAYAVAWQHWRGGAGRRRTALALAVVLAVLALAVLVYTGAEVMIVRARLLWHTYWLPLNFALTALVGAVGAVLFTLRWSGVASGDDYWLANRVQLAALVATAAAAVGWAVTGALGLGAGGGASFAEALRLAVEQPFWRVMYAGSAAVGGLLIAGTALALRRPALLAHSWWLSVPALLCTWSFRWVVFINVQTVPKYGAGLYPYELPLGSDGLLGIVATFGLWVAVVIIVSTVAARWPQGPAAAAPREVAHG
ncbi:NrfD/PsrC family molybdoenzyme membrane anchor subunit [Arhodomonas aquaeolei]|uniref:NrfD/PsrC family molybdoenzyme membrane anchor subunit n=1 Tax=Arhodomonas aquaeolei TaxID=2369 RepID=UPI000363E274|nr:NrfD/PsrC family molybdoenzyme membrane anchor subunit [Arhodomonas aquaeolei]